MFNAYMVLTRLVNTRLVNTRPVSTERLNALKGACMKKARVYLNWRDMKVQGLRQPMPIQIICGDCSVRTDEAGNAEILPIRTFLGKDGRCYTCGGTSFVFASDLCGVLRRTITGHRAAASTRGFVTAEENEGVNAELWQHNSSESLGTETAGASVREERETVRVAAGCSYQSHIN